MQWCQITRKLHDTSCTTNNRPCLFECFCRTVKKYVDFRLSISILCRITFFFKHRFIREPKGSSLLAFRRYFRATEYHCVALLRQQLYGPKSPCTDQLINFAFTRQLTLKHALLWVPRWRAGLIIPNTEHKHTCLNYIRHNLGVTLAADSSVRVLCREHSAAHKEGKNTYILISALSVGDSRLNSAISPSEMPFIDCRDNVTVHA